MCMVLYAAADAPLAELPERSPPAPFSARPIRGREEPVRTHFSATHVYFLGADTGCSCGFQYGPSVELESEGRESVRRLREYLADAVERAGSVEVYACWEGDEAEPLARRELVTLAYFADDVEAFGLGERWLATVVRNAG
jgi:hypothetical protein